MKEYKLQLPENLMPKSKEIMEFLLVHHYEDGVFSAGACAHLLNINKFDFQTKILGKFGICYLSEG